MNTLRAESKDQIAIGYASVASSSIYAGDYTTQQVKWIMTFRNAIYRGEYTGAEIRRIMDWLENVKEDGSNPIHHRNQMRSPAAWNIPSPSTSGANSSWRTLP